VFVVLNSKNLVGGSKPWSWLGAPRVRNPDDSGLEKSGTPHISRPAGGRDSGKGRQEQIRYRMGPSPIERKSREQQFLDGKQEKETMASQTREIKFGALYYREISETAPENALSVLSLRLGLSAKTSRYRPCQHQRHAPTHL
jgi:hypothetical protein